MKGPIVALALGSAVLLALTTLVAVPLWGLASSTPAVSVPPLLQGLPAGLREADAAFAARIAETFPPGSSEAVLSERLRTEGFQQSSSDDAGSDGAGSGGAREQRASFALRRSACVLTAWVGWRSEAHRLLSASGTYGATCL